MLCPANISRSDGKKRSTCQHSDPGGGCASTASRRKAAASTAQPRRSRHSPAMPRCSRRCTGAGLISHGSGLRVSAACTDGERHTSAARLPSSASNVFFLYLKEGRNGSSNKKIFARKRKMCFTQHPETPELCTCIVLLVWLVQKIWKDLN